MSLVVVTVMATVIVAAPVNWLGLHKVVEVMPASLALFAVSIAGNCLFIYCRDRLDRR